MNEKLKKKLDEIWKNKKLGMWNENTKEEIEKLKKDLGIQDENQFYLKIYKMGYIIDVNKRIFKKDEIKIYFIIKIKKLILKDSINDILNLDKENLEIFLNRLIKQNIIQKILIEGSEEEAYKIFGIGKFLGFMLDYEKIENDIRIEWIKKDREFRENLAKDISKIEKFDEKIETVENKIYGNIISFMGIFIAIFGVVTINYNFLSDLSQRVSVVETAIVAVIINFSLFVVLFFIFELVKSLMNIKSEKFSWDVRKIELSLVGFILISISILGVSFNYLYEIKIEDKNKITYAEKVLKVQEGFVNGGIKLKKVDAINGEETQELIKRFKVKNGYNEINIEITDELLKDIKNKEKIDNMKKDKK